MAKKLEKKPGATEYSFVFRATHRYARLSPFKARYIMDVIRQKPVNEALTILKFTNRRAANIIDKVLRSAIANAIDYGERKNVDVPVEQLLIKTAIADEGPRMKRWRARSRGIANPIIKRTSHLFIEVGLPKGEGEFDEDEEDLDEIREKAEKSKKALDEIEEKLSVEDEDDDEDEEKEEVDEEKTTAEADDDEEEAEDKEDDENDEDEEKDKDNEADEDKDENDETDEKKET